MSHFSAGTSKTGLRPNRRGNGPGGHSTRLRGDCGGRNLRHWPPRWHCRCWLGHRSCRHRFTRCTSRAGKPRRNALPRGDALAFGSRRATGAAVVTVAPAQSGAAPHLVPPMRLRQAGTRYDRQNYCHPYNRAPRHTRASMPLPRAIADDGHSFNIGPRRTANHSAAALAE
jgi:hypothetical protein